MLFLICNQTTSEAKGVRLHAGVAVTDRGLPLGILRCGFRPSDPANDHSDRQRWEDAMADAIAGAKQIRRSTKIVVVMDREADSAFLMKRCLDSGRVNVLVRAKHDRRLPNGMKLFGTLRGLEPKGKWGFQFSD